MFEGEWNRVFAHRIARMAWLILFVIGIGYGIRCFTDLSPGNINYLSGLSREELYRVRDEVYQALNDPTKDFAKAIFPHGLQGMEASQASLQIMKAIERKDQQENNLRLWENELKEIEEKAKVSIFQTPLSENILVQEKRVLERFIHSLKPESTIQTEMILKTRCLDVCWITWLFMLLYYLFLEMGDTKTEEFMKSLPRAEKKVHLTRFLLFLVMAMAGFFLLNGPMIIWSTLEYHDGIYLASWIDGFRFIKVSLTNQQLVICWIFLRFLSGIGLSSAFIFLSKKFKNMIQVSLLLLFIGLLSYGMAFFISIRSPLGFLRDFNLYGVIMLPERLLSGEWSVLGIQPLNPAVIGAGLSLFLLTLALNVPGSSFECRVHWKPHFVMFGRGWRAQTLFYWFIHRGALFILMAMVLYWGLQIKFFQYEKPKEEHYLSQYYVEYGGTMNQEKWDHLKQKNEEMGFEQGSYDERREKLLQNNLRDYEKIAYERLNESKGKRVAWVLFYERALQVEGLGKTVLVDPFSTKTFLMIDADRFRLLRALLQSSFFSLFLIASFSYYLDPESGHIFKTSLHGKKSYWKFMMGWIFILSIFFTIIPWFERLYITKYIGPIHWGSSIDQVMLSSAPISLGQVVLQQVLLQWSFLLALAGLLLMAMSHLKPLAVLISLLLGQSLLAMTSSFFLHPMAGYGLSWIYHSHSCGISFLINSALFLLGVRRSYQRNFQNTV